MSNKQIENVNETAIPQNGQSAPALPAPEFCRTPAWRRVAGHITRAGVTSGVAYGLNLLVDLIPAPAAVKIPLKVVTVGAAAYGAHELGNIVSGGTNNVVAADPR